jgi:hypothetical protein
MYEKIFGIQHRLTVLRLYKTILRLHQSLPYELRELGNQYVRDEFRRHKNAQPEFVTNFMIEWSVSIILRKKKDEIWPVFFFFFYCTNHHLFMTHYFFFRFFHT